MWGTLGLVQGQATLLRNEVLLFFYGHRTSILWPTTSASLSCKAQVTPASLDDITRDTTAPSSICFRRHRSKGALPSRGRVCSCWVLLVRRCFDIRSHMGDASMPRSRSAGLALLRRDWGIIQQNVEEYLWLSVRVAPAPVSERDVAAVSERDVAAVEAQGGEGFHLFYFLIP